MTGTSKEALAIIGAGIAGSTFSGMDQFAYEVYRGKSFTGNVRKLTVLDACKNAIDQVIPSLNLQANKNLVVVLNEKLQEMVATIFPAWNIPILTGSSLETTFSQISRSLQTDETDIALVIDLVNDSGTVSVMAVSTERFAEKNQIIPAGSLSISAGFDPEKSNLIVVNGNLPEFIENPVSITLIQQPFEKKIPVCALADSQPGLISILKLLVCVKNRIIPGVPDWDYADPESEWASSGFYVPVSARTWFTPADKPDRFGSVASVSNTGMLSFLNIQSTCDENPAPITIPSMEELCLFPFGGESIDDIIAQLITFKNTNFTQTNLLQAARFQYRRWQKNAPYTYNACILGSTPEELLREIDYALSGIPEAAGKASDWRTPAGSIFSPNPLGNSGSIAFVYPGAFNSYPGVGQDLLRLYPPMYQRLTEISTNLGELLNERQLYPRRFARILPEDMEQLEKQLVADPLAMLISGTCLAAVYTFLLREIFDIHPSSSMGYSLGEISMMFASGVWTRADETALVLRQSPLFHNRLAGSQDAVREFWKLTGNLPETADGRLWANYVLMASYEKVTEALKGFNHVYITHINTPRQVVIGGQPDECRQVISLLKCSSLEAPFNYALHCEAMESEYEGLQILHSWSVQNQPGMTLYSAATNEPLPIDQDAIAHLISYGLCHKLDFPKLVETAHSGGARIFIELGAGSNCTRWVDESLAGKPHTAFSINRKGVDDHSAILQLLARLISHGVPVNLSPIYG